MNNVLALMEHQVLGHRRLEAERELGILLSSKAPLSMQRPWIQHPATEREASKRGACERDNWSRVASNGHAHGFPKTLTSSPSGPPKSR